MADTDSQIGFELICRKCKNKDFITHKPNELQCSKCGQYVDIESIKRAQFAKKYARDNQQSVLDNKIAETGAKLVVTIQIKEGTATGGSEIGFPHYIHAGSRIEIYKAEDAIITAFYIREDLLDRARYERSSQDPLFELLICGGGLPELCLEGSNGGSVRVPVSQGPDKVVFTGATTGGVTTGGFYTQPGKIQYEQRTVSGYHYWKIKSTISFSPSETCVNIDSIAFRVFSHSGSYPERYARYFKDYSNYPKNGYNADYIWELPCKESSQVIEESDNIITPKAACPLSKLFHILVYQDALPDDEYYNQACSLLSKKRTTYSDLKKAAEMFGDLGDYKDSKLKRQTCFHEMDNGNYKSCYVATAVYGSYDCPQVWTLRRYRDYTLAETWYGRAFIHTYYAISPTLVKWFGKTHWFKNMWKPRLDRMVKRLNDEGVADTPYQDRKW